MLKGRDGRPRDDRARIYLQSLIMRAWAGLDVSRVLREMSCLAA